MAYSKYKQSVLRSFAKTQGLALPKKIGKQTLEQLGFSSIDELFEELQADYESVIEEKREKKQRERKLLVKKAKKYDDVVKKLRRSERIAEQNREKFQPKDQLENKLEDNPFDDPSFVKEYREFLNKEYKHPTDRKYEKEREYKNVKYKNKWKQRYFESFEGLENLVSTIRNVYQEQSTLGAFKLQLYPTYSLYRNNDDKDVFEEYRELDLEHGMEVLGLPKHSTQRKIIDAKYKKLFAEFKKYKFLIKNVYDNEAFFKDGPVVINNNVSLNKAIDNIVENFQKYQDTLNRPDSNWKFLEFLHFEFRVFHLDMTIGNAVSLPKYLYAEHFRTNVVKLENYEDNLCFWRCLAIHIDNPNRYDKLNARPLELCSQYYGKAIDKKTYPGIKYNLHDEGEISQVEQHFKVNIHIYIVNENEHMALSLERISPSLYEKNMYILRYDNHFCYIKHFNKVNCKFECPKCSKFFPTHDHCERHTKTCNEKKSNRAFVGGFCEERENFYTGLEFDQPYYPYYICYDFEAMLANIDTQKTECLSYSNEHVPISYSICSNVPGFTEPIFKVNKNTELLIDEFVQDLIKIAEVAREKVYIQFSNFSQYFESELEKKPKDKELIKKYMQFKCWADIIPVVGFNSQKYDFNLIKKNIFASLKKYDTEGSDFAPIKTGNSFKSFRTDNFNFLDITNYLAPNYSLEKWVKAYDCKVVKGSFPYEYIDTFDKLYENQLPPHEAFFSKLKNKNISVEDYETCKQAWKDNNMSNMIDFLKWYNNCDVIPMVEAIGKMLKFYQDKNLDMFKDGVSIPGLAYKLLLRNSGEDNKFSLFEEKDEDLYDMLFKSIVGGPSIIFNRYHVVDETKIREYQGGNKICKNIVGYDANALYLWSIAQEMPTGQYERVNDYDHTNISQAILNDKLFGFVKVDIEVPEHLKGYFAEMTPIFKNITIDPTENNIGTHMFEYAKSANRPLTKSKLLIGSYFGKEITLYTPLVKWYLNHGLVITKVYQAIKYNKAKCFEKLADDISDARRTGDIDKSKSIIADSMKLIGNSLYGRTVMNKSKFTKTSYCNETKIGSKINSPYFRDLDEIQQDIFEVKAIPAKIYMDIPIQIGAAVYQLAKLRMLEFYYDCVDKYVDRSDFEYCQMDTDSAYIAISANSLEDIIKPDMRADYELNKSKYFVPDSNEIYNDFEVKVEKEDEGKKIVETKKLTVNKYYSRTPGLFKVEKEVKCLVSLCSKMYCGEAADGEVKFSSKGIQKDNNKEATSFDAFKDVLLNQSESRATNRGFRVVDNKMITYVQNKKGLSYYYIKRKVLDDGKTTVPLDL